MNKFEIDLRHFLNPYRKSMLKSYSPMGSHSASKILWFSDEFPGGERNLWFPIFTTKIVSSSFTNSFTIRIIKNIFL